MRRLLLLVLVAALGYAAWPYWCAYSLAKGAEAGDRAALERYVDWSALRLSVKEEVGGALMAAQGPLGALGGAAGLGPSAADLGAALMGQAVDAALTPDAVARLILQSKRSGASGGADAAPTLRAPANFGGALPAEFTRENVKWAFFETPTVFVVHLAPRADREEIVKLRFRMVDFVWKLSDVDLPKDFTL